MKLYIKNKFFSLRGSSSVTDETGKDVFIVKGKFFTVTRKKRVKGTDGALLYTVRNKWLNVFTHSAFVYNGDGEKVAKVKRKFGFKNQFIIEGYQDEISIEGDFISWSLDIFRNGALIGTIRRRFDLTDSFVLETDTEDDAAFMVALVIAVDNIFDNMRSSN